MAWSVMVVAALWLTCLGLLLQSVGFAIPFWFGYETASSAATNDKTLQSYVGSWYVLSCVKSEASSCKTEAVEPEFKNATSNVDVIGVAFRLTTQDLIAKAASEVLGRCYLFIYLFIYIFIYKPCSVNSGLIRFAKSVDSGQPPQSGTYLIYA